MNMNHHNNSHKPNQHQAGRMGPQIQIMDSSNLMDQQFRQMSPSNRRAQGPGDWINIQAGEPHLTRGTPKNPHNPQGNMLNDYYQIGQQRKGIENQKVIPQIVPQPGAQKQINVTKSMDRVAPTKKEQYELQSALQMQGLGVELDQDQIGSNRFLETTGKVQSTKNNGAKKVRIGNSVKGAVSSKKKQGQNDQNISKHHQILAQANYSYQEISADPNDQFRGDTKHSFPQSEQVSYEQEQYSLKKGREGGQATSQNQLLDSGDLQTVSVGNRIVSATKPTHQGPSQQVKSKSKSGNPSSTRRKSSISNSRKPVAIIEPSHMKNFNKEAIAQHEFLGLGPQSNYTTTNAKNQRIGSISGDPNSMNFGQNIPIGVGSTINSTSQGVKGVIKLQNTNQNKQGTNKPSEFNCLINANQQNQPAILQQRQINIHNSKGAQKIPGRINKVQQQQKNNGKVAQKVLVKTSHPNEIQKQISNDSNNSMTRILNNKYVAQQTQIIGQHQFGQPGFNQTQNISKISEGLIGVFPQGMQNNSKNTSKNLMQAQTGASKKGSQNNKRQLVQQQKFSLLQDPKSDVTQYAFGNMDQFKPKLKEGSKGLMPAGSVPFGPNIFAQHGSSSVTNKVKKTFEFDVDSRGQIKRERNVGLSTQAQNNINNTNNKGIGMMPQNNINFINSGTGTKKGNQQKQAKVKTQMNLTGPLPKHLLSPANVANKSQGKSKHSQYFENSTEIVQGNGQQYQQQNSHLNASQQFHQMPKDGQQFVGFKDGNKPPLQAQYQVQLNSLNSQQVGQEGAADPHAQPQITASTQGCNTVININIDSNTWNRQMENNYAGQQNVNADQQTLVSTHNNNTRNQSNTQPTQGSVQNQVQYMVNDQNWNCPNNNRAPAAQYQTGKRQSSSKMRRNDSISSNKSRRNNHNSNNNRRSSSSSHMNNHQQIHQLQQLNSLQYNQQNMQQVVNSQPHSNTDILLNNIAKINEHLNEKFQNQQQENNILNPQQQKLLININNNMASQGQDHINLNQTTKIAQLKSKSLNKDPLIQSKKQPVYNNQGQQIFKSINKKSGINSLNQTQKLAQLSNATSITVNDSMQQQMLSIIPKKQVLEANTPVNRKSSQKQLKVAPFPKQGVSNTTQQKLTLKKVTSNRKTPKDQQSSQMGSARNKKQAGNNRYYVQEQIQILQQSHDQANSRDNEFDQHLLEMDYQIQQKQLRVRNELAQIQNVKANGQQFQQDQMNEMGMDVDMEDILIDNQLSIDDNTGNQSGLNQYDRQLQIMQQNIYKNSQNYQTNNVVSKTKYQTQQQNMKRQQSQHEQNQSVEGQLIQQHQGSQLRASNQKRGNTQQSSQITTLSGTRNTGSRTKGKVNRVTSSKVNIEDIQIDVDDIIKQQLIMDSSQGLAAAVQNFGTKKSFTTKNQNLSKMHATQNVQSLLREAKREMLIDPNELDQIQVGGDDLTVKNTQKKRFNFNGTQNLVLGNNFGTQASRGNSQYGNSPKNKNDDYGTVISGTLSSYPNNNNYKTNNTVVETFNGTQVVQNKGTFGLGQINMKKQIKQKGEQVQKDQVQSQFINQMQQQHSQNQNKQQEEQNQLLQQQQQQKYIQMQQLQKVKNQQKTSEQIVLQSQQLQQQSKNSSITSSKQNIPQQFQQKPVQSQQVQKPESREPQNSQSQTFNSQESEHQRNSNMPPNSSEILKDNNSNSNENLQSASQTQIVPVQDDQLQLPISGAKCLKHYLKRSGLTEYEKSEILDYRQCYYLGIGAQKIQGSKHQQYNFGYDDERGDYCVVLKDHIAYRFEVLDFLGKGSFGQALKCVDHKTQEIVALKIIRNKKKFQHQAGVELKILLHLKENDPDDTNNIIRIKDYCMFRKHLVISFELFSINLYEFIKNNNFEGVSLSLIRRFAIQILQALKYLREESLIHCDLKPENILLKSPDKSGIKVIDFGSSCFSNERIYTYIQSRFYRAPEIILGIPYTTAIDMWSFGCILTELFTGVPIFPGESEQEQLSLIMQVIGLPKEEILAQATRKKVFFDEQTGEPYLSQDSQGNLRIPNSKPLDEILMCQSESFQDFIKCCLEWNPENRITPFEALMHEWIIEGLPPQVLIHHKKMLGIYESDTEDEVEQLNGNQTQSAIEESQNQSQAYELEQYNHQIDSNDLSSSRIQGLNEQSITDYDIAERNNQNQLQIGKIISNNLEENAYQDQQSIDFYGQNVKNTEQQDYSSRYESILSNGANKNLLRNKKNITDTDPKVQNSKDRAKQLQVNQPTRSDMQEDDPQWEEMETNPQINLVMGQAMRGQQMHNQNNQFTGIVLNEGNSKSKTTNMTEILSQVNKKSKSTKNQARGGIQYSVGKDNQMHVNFQQQAAGTQALNIVHNNYKQKAFGQVKKNSLFQNQQHEEFNQLNSRKMEIDEQNNHLVDMDTERDEIMDIDNHREYQ